MSPFTRVSFISNSLHCPFLCLTKPNLTSLSAAILNTNLTWVLGPRDSCQPIVCAYFASVSLCFQIFTCMIQNSERDLFYTHICLLNRLRLNVICTQPTQFKNCHKISFLSTAVPARYLRTCHVIRPRDHDGVLLVERRSNPKPDEILKAKVVCWLLNCQILPGFLGSSRRSQISSRKVGKGLLLDDLSRKIDQASARTSELF